MTTTTMTKQELLAKANKLLNKVELKFFQMMFPQDGVLFIQGRPGTAKSAILRSIAKKLEMEFIDLRLPTMDETDLGVFPVVNRTGEYPVLEHAIPKWAHKTRENPDRFYLIVTEELNRADKPQRNAALGFLNEKIIGTEFQFGPNVFLAATGNIGTEDGTDVEEFDNALKSRLIPVKHEMEGADGLMFWIEAYATDHVHPDIIRFLEAHPTAFYPPMEKNGDGSVIVCPRTWTFLSTAILELFGKNATIDDFGGFLMSSGSRYIGAFAVKLERYLSENRMVTLPDVLAGKVKKYDKITRDNRAALMTEITEKQVDKYSKKEFNHILELMESFRKSDDTDIIVGNLYDWITKFGSDEKEAQKWVKSENFDRLIKTFKKEIEFARKENDKAAKVQGG